MRSHAKRRELLSASAGISSLLLAGCLGEITGNGSENGEDQDQNNQNAGQQQSQGQLNVGTESFFHTGNWEPLEEETGWDVNVVSFSNDPSEVMTTLLAGGGRSNYDVIMNVGGIETPLLANDAIQSVDTNLLPNYNENAYDFYNEHPQGAQMFKREGELIATPFIWQGDSFGYNPDAVSDPSSYGVLFDKEFAGRVALHNNWSTALHKAAEYLKQNNMADIENSRSMTESEVSEVVDFLIEKKNAGQFRTIYGGLETAVQLMVSNEVDVIETWEPVVISAQNKEANWEYAEPDEGYLLWAGVHYLINPEQERSQERLEATHKLMDYMFSGQFGAVVAAQTGYLTNKAAISYAEENDEGLYHGETVELDAEEIRETHENVRRKYEDVGGFLQNRWPETHDAYEKHWQRFLNA